MRYYKDINNGYIIAIGIGGNGVEITEAEYNQIANAIQNKPQRDGTTDYHLKTDLTWEAYERDIIPPSDEIDTEEAFDILMGDAE